MARTNSVNGNQRKTFSQVCEESRDQANRSLFARAATASQLAKSVGGGARTRLYQVKHRCIDQLIGRGHVVVGVDQDLHVGLLSINVIGSGRLHTHESWLRESRGRCG